MDIKAYRKREFEQREARLKNRIGLTLYKLDKIMDGDIQEIIDACIIADQNAKLAKMNEN